MRSRFLLTLLTAAALVGHAGFCPASDHLDTPSVIADPRTDIGDVYAWMSPAGHRLNLVMTIVGHTFSEKVGYVFHIDSGRSLGDTVATTSIECRFPGQGITECRAGEVDSARGDASQESGLPSRKRHFKVFAGLRDDPFFNNVKGTRAAQQKAAAALSHGAARDAAGCPGFDASTVAAIQDEWRHTEGGPARNLLAGWTPVVIVISVDREIVDKGGSLLAVWGATVLGARQLDRAGRPLTGNALLGLLASEDVSNAFKEEYNAETPAGSKRFIPEIQKALGLYDGFDGKCGNQLLAGSAVASGSAVAPADRYRALATLLADDRLWINSASSVCTQLFAVELSALAGRPELSGDCGGRTPNYDASNVYRSLLVDGTSTSITDGLHADELKHSASVFPFIAPPASVQP